jgi:hypothetical protein
LTRRKKEINRLAAYMTDIFFSMSTQCRVRQ